MTQFWFKKIILLQFTYTYWDKYIVFWVAEWNVIISDIASKCILYETCKYFLKWVWDQIYNKIGLVSCLKVISAIEIMWFNVITFANWYGHYLQYSVKKSYRYIKWKLLKGRHVTYLKLEILGLNMNISQKARLLYCNDSVLVQENNFTSVYIHILRQIYCFLSCRMECYNFWHCFKMHLIWDM